MDAFLYYLIELAGRDCFGEDEYTREQLSEYFGHDVDAAYLTGFIDGKISLAREMLRGGILDEEV